MTFWSGEKIRKELLANPDLIEQSDPDCIIGASYRLKMGREYYASSTNLDPDRNTRTVTHLDEGECFSILAGQFALLLTEEVMNVPIEVIGLFSIRPGIKWKGLINVSGFHIDPGFRGRLTIAVYNAGSTPIHLRQGEPTFPVWFADLDKQSEADYKKYEWFEPAPRVNIDVDVLNQAPAEAESLQSLASRIRDVDEKIDKKLVVINLYQALITWFIAVVVAAVVSVLTPAGVNFVRDRYLKPERPSPSAPPSASTSPGSPVPATPKAHS